MTVKLTDFLNIVTFNEKINIFGNDDKAIFLGNRDDLLTELQSNRILANKTVSHMMIVKSVIIITVK